MHQDHIRAVINHVRRSKLTEGIQSVASQLERALDEGVYINIQQATDIQRARADIEGMVDTNFYGMAIKPPWPVAYLEWIDLMTEEETGRLHRFNMSASCIASTSNPGYVWISIVEFETQADFGLATGGFIHDELGRFSGYIEADDEADTENHLANTARRDRAVGVVLSAYALCHCRNVELVEMSLPRAERRRLSRSEEPHAIWRTIKIDGLRHELVERANSVGFINALHLCRGNFATYEDKGMFGNPKLKGTYWRPSHVKGSPSKGMSSHEYKIIPPGSK